jgi:hypothetical protein
MTCLLYEKIVGSDPVLQLLHSARTQNDFRNGIQAARNVSENNQEDVEEEKEFW